MEDFAAEIGDVIVTRKDYEREGGREETATEIMQILCKSWNGVTLIRVTISKVIGRIDVVFLLSSPLSSGRKVAGSSSSRDTILRSFFFFLLR